MIPTAPLLLAISTASPVLSIALVSGPAVLARHHEHIGRGHAEALVPAIAALLAGQPRPAAIAVDTGPGSYTGIRIGIAAARALGLAWQVPVHGLSGLALVAAQAFAGDPACDAVLAVVDAGRRTPVGAIIGRDLVVPAVQRITALLPGLATAGAGAALLQPAQPPRHGSEPDAGYAGHLPAASLGAPVALYLDD